MIEAQSLSKRFGNFEAVRSIDLQVKPGELVALLGPNGAGKTTTVRMLGAILRPSGGYARICGLDIVKDARKVRASVGLLTEYPGLYGRMQALEYLDFFAALLGVAPAVRSRRAEGLLRQFGLWEARGRRLDGYSKGMKQKMALVRALIHDPPVLFLDEPTTAMDPQSARTVRDAIGELRAADRSILLTTHNLTEAEVLADRIAIVRGGRVVAVGTIAELTRQLLGEPLWELRFVNHEAAQAAVPCFEQVARIEQHEGAAIQYRCSDPAQVNPILLARVAAQGLPLLAISEVGRTLEDVYLRIVAEDEAVRPGDDRDPNTHEPKG